MYAKIALVAVLGCQACFLSSGNAHADSVYGYVDADGHKTYSNLPHEGAERVQLAPLPPSKRKHFDVNTKNGVSIGMTREQVVASSWGRPEDIHKRYTTDGTTEQWEYAGNRYLYFRNGVLEEISK